ncbi:MAG TPA: Maf family protein [Phycisphaerae bacterium]|nr:Maf family protein [Phycisphaerae bacterium]
MKSESAKHSNNRFILASASPRRRGLLAEWGFSFDVFPSPVDEPDAGLQEGSPAEVAKALAEFKADQVARMHPDAIVLGADTVVALDGTLYGKAEDAADARRILSTLMHHTHEVITGVAIIDGRTGRREVAADESLITMTPMTPSQLDAYIESGMWQGKAGAYGVQDHDDQFVKQLDGSFTNVVGLPKDLVIAVLARFGLEPSSTS